MLPSFQKGHATATTQWPFWHNIVQNYEIFLSTKSKKYLFWDPFVHKQTKDIKLKLNYCSYRTQFPSLGTFVSKKVGNQKTKTTFIISVLKVVYQVVLVFSISNFFINKKSQGRKLSAKKKIPTCSNSALVQTFGPDLLC